MLSYVFNSLIRNKRRALLTSLAVYVSVFVVLVIIAYSNGFVDNMIDGTRLYETGDIRIRNKLYSKYENSKPVNFYIQNDKSIINEIIELDRDNNINSIERLVSVDGVLNLDEMMNFSLVGLDINNSKFFQSGTIVKGREINSNENEICVTQEFLDKTKLSINDEVTVLVRTKNSGTNAIKYKIVGIVAFPSVDKNRFVAYCDIENLMGALRIDGCLEILIRLNSKNATNELMNAINGSKQTHLSSDSLDIRSMEEVSFIAKSLYMIDASYMIIELLFFFIAATLILNTLLMSVNERKREIGVLIALGFTRQKIRLLFILEGCLFGLIGSFGAIITVVIFLLVLGTRGIDLSLFGAGNIEGWNLPRLIYPKLSAIEIIQVNLLLLLIVLIVCVFSTRLIMKKDSIWFFTETLS